MHPSKLRDDESVNCDSTSDVDLFGQLQQRSLLTLVKCSGISVTQNIDQRFPKPGTGRTVLNCSHTSHGPLMSPATPARPEPTGPRPGTKNGVAACFLLSWVESQLNRAGIRIRKRAQVLLYFLLSEKKIGITGNPWRWQAWGLLWDHMAKIGAKRRSGRLAIQKRGLITSSPILYNLLLRKSVLYHSSQQKQYHGKLCKWEKRTEHAPQGFCPSYLLKHFHAVYFLPWSKNP